MPVVLCATWVAREGYEDQVLTALRELARASRGEPGALYYQAYQKPDEPRVFRIFEVYVDEEAMKAHAHYPHFAKWAIAGAIPLLEERSREVFQTVGG